MNYLTWRAWLKSAVIVFLMLALSVASLILGILDVLGVRWFWIVMFGLLFCTQCYPLPALIEWGFLIRKYKRLLRDQERERYELMTSILRESRE